MLNYILRRIGEMIPTTLGILLLTFVLFNVIGGSPAETILGKNASAESIAAFNAQYGYDKPLIFAADSQFVRFLSELVRGDFGYSLENQEPVIEVLRRGVGPSLSLTVPILVGSVFVGLVLAFGAAACRGGFADKAILLGSTVLMSVNYVVWVLAGQFFLSYKAGLFPVWGYESAFFLILPILIGIVSSLGTDVRFFRTVILDEIYRPYVLTARAKGLSRSVILIRHVLRNALIPIVTYVSLSIPGLFTGSLLLESFFGIPGLGSASINAIHSADMAVVRTVVVLGALLYQFVNLATDLAYAALDPRVRLVSSRKAKACLVAVLLLPCASAFATSEELSTAGWTGSGETNGWTYSKLAETPYSSDGQQLAMKFSSGGAEVASPHFNWNLTAVEIAAFSSSLSPNRFLTVTFVDKDGQTFSGPTDLAAASRDDQNRPYQHRFDFEASAAIRSFRIKLVNSVSGGANSTQWGVYGFRLTFVDSAMPSQPRTLFVGSRKVRLQWSNQECACANEVCLAQTRPISSSYAVVYSQDFAACTNSGSQAREITNGLSELLPHFGGSLIYLPPNSTNAIQIGKRDAHGLLTFDSPIALDDLTLLVTARRVVTDDEGFSMPVFAIDGAATNQIASVALTNELRRTAVPLDGVSGTRMLGFHSANDRSLKRSGRVIVSSIELVADYVPEGFATNLIRTVKMSGTSSCEIDGLEPGRDYLWAVRGFDSSGAASDLTEFIPFTTRLGGTSLFYR